jgi:hypothetical protein
VLRGVATGLEDAGAAAAGAVTTLEPPPPLPPAGAVATATGAACSLWRRCATRRAWATIAGSRILSCTSSGVAMKTEE